MGIGFQSQYRYQSSQSYTFIYFTDYSEFNMYKQLSYFGRILITHRNNFNLGFTISFNSVLNHTSFIFLTMLSRLLHATDSHRFKLNIYLPISGIRLIGPLPSILNFLLPCAQMVFNSYIRMHTHSILAIQFFI